MLAIFSTMNSSANSIEFEGIGVLPDYRISYAP